MNINEPCRDLPESIGFLVIGHGTRNERGTEEVFRLSELLSERLAGNLVETAFLELRPPSIEHGWDRLCDAGAKRIVAVPLLLFTAGHALRDIPEALAACHQKWLQRGQTIPYVQTPSFQCHPQILELSRERADSALRRQIASGQAEDIDLGRTALLMVGRGSLDAQATEKMHELALLRSSQQPFAKTSVAFLAMAKPTISVALDELSSCDAIEQILVQPHLLFQGDLLTKLSDQVARMRSLHGDKQWLLAEHLGPSGLIVDAVIDLAQQSQALSGNTSPAT